MLISDWSSDVCSSDLDECALFLHQVGVPLPGSPGGAAKTQVTTYTLDVFNAQQDANQSALLFNIARVGGGKYFQAKNEDAIVAALKDIFAAVQSVHSAFSSVSMPVNATNRAQNENQVLIGVFTKLGRASCRERVCHYV